MVELNENKIVNDEWTFEDYLDHKSHVETVAKVVQTCNPPYVLGIHGDWGTGKTSFLHKLHLYLAHTDSGCQHAKEKINEYWPDKDKKPDNIETIWFDAWRYQFEANPVIALLSEIRAHFTWTRKLMGKTAKVGQATLMTFGEIIKKIGVHTDKITEAGEKWERDRLYQPLPSQLCKELLEKAISDLLGTSKKNKKKRLVIFVDDLDRCEGAVAFRFLEAMKIYLSIPSCVFVIGLDTRQINKAVANELKKSGMIPERDNDSAEVYAIDYLSKMFQQIYYLPSMANQRAFLENLLNGMEYDNKTKWIDIIIREKILPPNPRKIKKFATGLTLYLNQINHRLQGEEPDRELALIVIYLKLMANNIYRLLESSGDFWNHLVEFCKNPDNCDHPILKKYKVPFAPSEDGHDLESRFPDPANERLLHIAPLIRKYRDGERPAEDKLKLYLLQ